MHVLSCITGAAIYDNLAEPREQQTSHSDPIKRRRSPADIEFDARKTCSSTKLNGTGESRVENRIEVELKLESRDSIYPRIN